MWTNLQSIGFFGMKKPIICKIVDSVILSQLLPAVISTSVTQKWENTIKFQIWSDEWRDHFSKVNADRYCADR